MILGFGTAFSPMSLVLILVIVILLFGTKRLRSMGSDLGDALKSFKKAVKDEETPPSANQQVTQDDKGRVIDVEVTQKDKV